MANQDKSERKSYVFNVDLLLEDTSNAKALETLLKALNQSPFIDFKIQSGLEFGRLIEQLKQEQRQKANVNVPPKLVSRQAPAAKPAAAAAKSPAPKQAAGDSPIPAAVVERINGYIAANQLIRLNVNKGRGVKLSVPCRIVGFDETARKITVYHVDEKKVYAFSLNEIDDFV